MKTKDTSKSEVTRLKVRSGRISAAEMKIIFYTGNRKDIPKKLKNLFEPDFSESMEICVSLENLKDRLSMPLSKYRSVIVIIAAESWEDLMNIVSLEYLLRDTRLVLILPNRKKETISLGYKLRPRYLTYKDADYQELVSVIRKMMGDRTKLPPTFHT